MKKYFVLKVTDTSFVTDVYTEFDEVTYESDNALFGEIYSGPCDTERDAEWEIIKLLKKYPKAMFVIVPVYNYQE